MNLSVVMQTIDKMSAPLKKITSAQSKYGKQIAEIKKQSARLAGDHELIKSYRSTAREAGKSGVKLKEAQANLDNLNAKLKSSTQPSIALQQELEKQKEKLEAVNKQMQDSAQPSAALVKQWQEQKDKLAQVNAQVKATAKPSKVLLNQLAQQKEKLAQVNKKMQDSAKPSAALVKQLELQKEKVAQVNAKIKAGAQPSAALLKQLDKQKKTLKDLKEVQASYSKALVKTQNKMKAKGINLKRLSSEEKRLTKTYKQQMSEIDRLAKKDDRLLKVRQRLAKLKMPNMHTAEIVGASTAIAGLVTLTNSHTAEVVGMAKAYDMSISKFTQWGGIAQQAGLNAENVGDMVEELTNKFGEFKALGKQSSVSDAFGVLKLNKSMLEGKSSVQQFELIMKRLQGIKDKQKAASIADMLFGGESNKLVTYIKNSGNSLEHLLKAQKQVSLLSKEGASGALRYSKAFKVLQSTVTSAWAEISGIIGGEFANDITRLAKRLSNFVRNNKAEIVTNIKALIQHIKAFGKAFLFISQHIPEVIAAIALLKIGIIALNVAMWANPIGLIIAGIAAAVVVVGYLLQKMGWLIPVLSTVVEFVSRLGALLIAPFIALAGAIVGIIRLIMKMVTLMPLSLLPDSWAKNIKSAQQCVEGLGKTVNDFAETDIDYALNGERKETLEQTIKSKSQHSPLKSSSTENGGYGMLRHPTVQSKSQVDVRIKSDKPVEIIKAESDKHTEMNVDTFDLLGWSL